MTTATAPTLPGASSLFREDNGTFSMTRLVVFLFALLFVAAVVFVGAFCLLYPDRVAVAWAALTGLLTVPGGAASLAGIGKVIQKFAEQKVAPVAGSDSGSLPLNDAGNVAEGLVAGAVGGTALGPMINSTRPAAPPVIGGGDAPLVLTHAGGDSALSDDLRAEYRRNFDSATVRPSHATEIQKMADAIVSHRDRYRAVGGPLGIPWVAVGLIHAMEASLSFTTHLHNGDPLRARTVHVPKGRPADGKPPFGWEESATDALKFDGWDRWKDWSLEGMLYEMERFNGLGYRRRGVLSAYLWSFTTLYAKGKFTDDGHFDPNAVSGQAGVAALLRVLVDDGVVNIG